MKSAAGLPTITSTPSPPKMVASTAADRSIESSPAPASISFGSAMAVSTIVSLPPSVRMSRRANVPGEKLISTPFIVTLDAVEDTSSAFSWPIN